MCQFLYVSLEICCYFFLSCGKIVIRDFFRGEDLQEEDYVNFIKLDSTVAEKRKRINRIKMAIIIIIIVMMLLPTILCIVLGVQVSRLQENVNDLMEIHGRVEQPINITKGKENYAYAAEKPDSDKADKQEENQKENIDAAEPSKENLNLSESDQRQRKHAVKSNQASADAFDASKSSDSRDGIYAGKTVYLTFDDGPSIYTNDILDILAEYDVKATFFVIGKTDDESKEAYRRIVEEGHTIGMHSYSHNYNQIYKSIEDFDKDFTNLWDLLYDIIGYRLKIYRFPGGSANQVNPDGMEKFIRYLNDKSVVYFDWNVENKDATGIRYTKEELIDNVLTDVARKKRSIVLMHDSSAKGTTVESLAELIETLLSEGASILPLTQEVPPIQQIEADSIE